MSSIDDNIHVIRPKYQDEHFQCDQCDLVNFEQPYFEITLKVNVLFKTIDVKRKICINCAREFKKVLSKRLAEVGIYE